MIAHTGMWGIAVVVTVLVSWMLYRYLAPHGWKEWSRAGVVQAFIIALYAEMYGFPLTLYFLARIFGVDLQFGDGSNLWSQLFGAPTAHLVAMVIGYAIVFSGAGLVVDGWRRVFKARQEDHLVSDGSYARVRHPQYTGLFLIAFGEGVVHWPTLLSLIGFPIIVVAYVLLARREERDMVARFGDEYREYQRRVPMFIPRPGSRFAQRSLTRLSL
jgi:protein-S-isoprenylcysteine O-methyltransferase Ste14